VCSPIRLKKNVKIQDGLHLFTGQPRLTAAVRSNRTLRVASGQSKNGAAGFSPKPTLSPPPVSPVRTTSSGGGVGAEWRRVLTLVLACLRIGETLQRLPRQQRLRECPCTHKPAAEPTARVFTCASQRPRRGSWPSNPFSSLLLSPTQSNAGGCCVGNTHACVRSRERAEDGVEEHHSAVEIPFAGVTRCVGLRTAPSNGVSSVPLTGGGARARPEKPRRRQQRSARPFARRRSLGGHGAARWPASVATKARLRTSDSRARAADNEPQLGSKLQ
jgi:hypothetical protein